MKAGVGVEIAVAASRILRVHVRRGTTEPPIVGGRKPFVVCHRVYHVMYAPPAARETRRDMIQIAEIILLHKQR